MVQSLHSQEEILLKILSTLDTSTRRGKIQANQVRLEMKGLEREEKDLQRQLVTAYLDSAIQKVMQSHARHRSIIITTQKAAGIGLRKGLFDGISKKLQTELVGNVDPSQPKRKSRTALEILRERMNVLQMNPVQFAPKFTSPNITQKQIPQPPKGNTSADSMVNVGKYMIQIGEQQRQENQEVHNQFGEPATQYGVNRLNNAQAISP